MRRSRSRLVSTAIAVPALLWCAAVTAHGDVDEQIATLGRTLDRAAGENAEEPWRLYLLRGELHRREAAWEDALADFDRALALRPDDPAAMLGRAQVHLDRGEHDEAIRWSTRILSRWRDHGRAALVRARAQMALGRADEAVLAYEITLASLDRATPEHYLEYAQALRSSDSPDADRRAVAALDEGATALRHPATLHRVVIEIEREAGRHAAALERVDALLAREPRLHDLQRVRSELLVALGRPTEARAGLRALLARLHELPPRRRDTPAMRDLIERAERDLTRLEPTDTGSRSEGPR